MPKNYPRDVFIQACRDYGNQLHNVPDGIEGSQLLWAMSGNESSFGTNCVPKHEPAFDYGGKYESGNLARLDKFGTAAACSYGPWQIMFPNCPDNYTPEDMDNLDKAAVATILYLNKQLNRYRPMSLEQVGSIWNGGNPRANTPEYNLKLRLNYNVPMETV